jgi:hypothetical protein
MPVAEASPVLKFSDAVPAPLDTADPPLAALAIATPEAETPPGPALPVPAPAAFPLPKLAVCMTVIVGYNDESINIFCIIIEKRQSINKMLKHSYQELQSQYLDCLLAAFEEQRRDWDDDRVCCHAIRALLSFDDRDVL